MNLQKLKRSSLCFILLLALSVGAFAQDKDILGQVTDQETGKPLSGVTISIKGTTRSVITNAEGKFAFKGVSPEAVISVSYIGFDLVEMKVGDKTFINAPLLKANNTLDDVVVIGYGSQKRAHLTGSVATIDMKQIQDIPTGNLSEALKGQIVGLNVSGGYARPGEPATLSIRNPIFYSKDGQSKDPIYVIDDVLRSLADFNLLDASEIESISVLKDAAAAIYGIIGSNGVIIVKTKRGKVGAPRINYTASYGVTDATKMPKMMNGYEQALYLNDLNFAKNNTSARVENWVYDSTKPEIYRADELESFKNNNYDWLAMGWQQAQQMRHALNISGGTDRATYFAGFSYDTQNSNFDGLRYNRYSFRSSSDIKLANGLKLALSLAGNLGDKKNTFNKQGGESLDNDWKTLIYTSQFNPPFINGLPILVPGAGNNAAFGNYHYFAVHNSNNYTSSKSGSINFQGQLSYEIPFIKGLKASVNYNRNISFAWNKQYGTSYKVYSFFPSGSNKHLFTDSAISSLNFKNGDIVSYNPTYVDAYQVNGLINYDRSFGKHQVGALFGYEQQETKSDAVVSSVEGVLANGNDNENFATGVMTATQARGGTVGETGRLAYIGRLDYNYASKYILQVQFRADASQNFAPENRWGYFPSVSAGWVVSEEPFFAGLLNSVNYLKIRGSAGWMGLDNTKPYQWSRVYALQTGKAPVYGGNGDRGLAILPDIDLANRDVHWDNVTKYNAGVDLKFLNNRLSATIDGYIDQRRGMLTTLSSSPSLLIGATIPTENYSDANNFGYEASLSWRDRVTSDLSYTITANFTWTENKVLKTDVPVGNIGTFLDPTGHSTDQGFYGYHTLGMFRTQADIDAWQAQYPSYKMFSNPIRPGMLIYEDIRGPKDPSTGKYAAPDGTITVDDQDFLRKKQDNHYGLGFNWGVTYKTLSLNVVMGLSWGGINTVDGDSKKVGNSFTNRPSFWADHWSPATPDAKYPDPFQSANYDNPSDFWWVKSTTFRVTNFNLSYTLPNKWTSKAKFQSARFFLVGSNPINFLNYYPNKYRDPGASYNTYPQLKSLSLGLNLSM